MAEYSDSKKKEISEEIKTDLKVLVDHFTEEDRAVRERQIRIWRKLKLYWSGFTRIWYSETAHDWRVWDETYNADGSEDNAYYDKPVNMFRAWIESIIAALSITIPKVRCVPDDADNPLDISTAKAGNKISQLIAKHNNDTYLWLHALYIFATEGLTACYSYPKEDAKYGTYEKQEYKKETTEAYQCPFCGTELSDDLFTQREEDEYMPDEDDVSLHDIIINEQEIICPECAKILDPNLEKTNLVVDRLVGITKAPKTRQCMEVYGGLYVKVPNYAMKQEDMPYLIFSYETHYANAIEMYPHLRDKIRNDGGGLAGGSFGGNNVYDAYESWGRLSTQYQGEYPVNNVTVRNCWFRPKAFNILATEDKVDEMKRRFPDGVKVVFVNDCYADACNESLDDCWTLTKNPLADYLHHDPLGLLLVTVQDLTNDLISLITQTIEQGIPQTFVDPAVVNIEAYRQLESTVGGVYATKAVPANKNISDAFYQFKAAALSDEVMPFLDRIQQFGQTVVGAQPSIFGGELGGSKTASEYSMSRAQALQRLQTPWKTLSIWWKEIFGKVIPSFIKEMADDERLVEKDKQGNYVNVFIRKAEVQGKIGDVELESSENLPVSWAQIKEVLMGLLETQNPVFIEALMSPENLPMLTEALGIPDFKIPGEDDRQKQYEEIQQLLQSEPIIVPVSGDEMLMMAEAGEVPEQQRELPSVEIDPELDNHEIEAAICRSFLISEPGRLAKQANPPGYMNVLLHYKQHLEVIQQQAMMQQMQAQAEAETETNNKQSKKAAKQQSENDNARRSVVR